LARAAHPVTLVYRQRRLVCRRCGIRTERIEFADAKTRVTRRLRQQIGVDCQSMPTSPAAVRHGVSWGKARRTENAFLADWDRTRASKRLRHLGLDEIQRGKGQQFWTVLSDVVHGEVIGLGQDRTETSATTLLMEDLTPWQRAAVTAVCSNMHRPYLNAVGTALKDAEIVFDKFHVLQHARAALDEVPAGILSRWRGDAGARPREGMAAAPTLEDGAGFRNVPSCKRCSRRTGVSSRRTCGQALPAQRLDPAQQEVHP
jgi:transposase